MPLETPFPPVNMIPEISTASVTLVIVPAVTAISAIPMVSLPCPTSEKKSSARPIVSLHPLKIVPPSKPSSKPTVSLETISLGSF
jgi:hypothetical protein